MWNYLLKSQDLTEAELGHLAECGGCMRALRLCLMSDNEAPQLECDECDDDDQKRSA